MIPMFDFEKHKQLLLNLQNIQLQSGTQKQP